MKLAIQILLFVFSLALFSCKSAKQTKSDSSKTNESQTKLFTKHDIDVNHYFVNANKEKLLGNTEDAIRLFKKCLQIDPNNAAAAYELSIIALNANDFQNAELFSRKAYNINPENEWYAILFVESLQRNKKPGEAIKVYQKLIKSFPERSDIYYDFADCYLRMNKPDEAIEIYDELEKKTGGKR